MIWTLSSATAEAVTIRAAASEIVLTFATVKKIYEAMKGQRK